MNRFFIFAHYTYVWLTFVIETKFKICCIYIYINFDLMGVKTYAKKNTLKTWTTVDCVESTEKIS